MLRVKHGVFGLKLGAGRIQMNARASKRFDEQFKIGAVKLVTEEKRPTGEVASDLGISKSALYAWVRKYGEHSDDAFPGSGNLMPKDKELHPTFRSLI